MNAELGMWGCATVSTWAAPWAVSYIHPFIHFHPLTTSCIQLYPCIQLHAWTTAPLQDRQHMGLLSGVLDHDPVLYVMTLGVLEAHRNRGLATNLIAIACQHAYETRWDCWVCRFQLIQFQIPYTACTAAH
jgi:hypothetical protein